MDKILTEFLEKKCVALDVAARKRIQRLPNGNIQIPVFNDKGKFIFNKFRRDPAIAEGSSAPKYSYEVGASASLYNSHMLELLKEKPVFICEGEFKALCLESFQMLAVSSTGGVGTFHEEWIERLKNREVYIILDNDAPGIKGSFILQQKIPWARIIFLPVKGNFLGNNWGKDINDLAHSLKEGFMPCFSKLIETAENWHYKCPKEFENKTELNDTIRYMQELLTQIIARIGAAKSMDPVGENPYEWLEVYKGLILWEIGGLKRTYKNFSRHKMETKYSDKFNIAKNIPISRFIKFNYSGFAHSVWNPGDKNPSMKYYAEKNRVFDYSTGQGGDAIDIAQAFWNCGFKEAIDKLISL